jgi:hypothetical protein
MEFTKEFSSWYLPDNFYSVLFAVTSIAVVRGFASRGSPHDGGRGDGIGRTDIQSCRPNGIHPA